MFNGLSAKSGIIYRPNESKIYVFYGNGNNSISVNVGLPYSRTGGASWLSVKHCKSHLMLFFWITVY